MILLLILSLALQPVNTTYLAKAATSTSLEASENAGVTLHSKNKRPSVYADSAILMDANTGAILYAKNIHEQLYPASITKLLSTYVALQECELDEMVTFSEDAVYSINWWEDANMGVYAGSSLTLEEVLYGIVVVALTSIIIDKTMLLGESKLQLIIISKYYEEIGGKFC